MMKKILVILFFTTLASNGQQIISIDQEPLMISENTINYLTENGYEGSLFGAYSQLINVDFNNDDYLDVITMIAGNPYLPSILSVFIWDNENGKFVEDHNFLTVVEGESALWEDCIGDFNGDGLTDLYVPVGNYHGEPGLQPDYYPYDDSMNMPGHLFLNNGSGFDSQYIDDSMHDGYGFPNYERGFVLDIDNDGESEIVIPSINQHPENTPANNFLSTKYHVNSNNEISYEFIYQWEDTYNTSSGFYMASHSVILRDYNNRIYVLYPGNEEWSSNGPYMYPEVSVYSKEKDDQGNFILLDKFRLERGDDINNQDSFVNRDTFYIQDLDHDGFEEFIIQMYTLDAVPHGGLHIFDYQGNEITSDWFHGIEYLGNSANGFYVNDFNGDGFQDILMVDVYTDNYNESVFFLNNNGQNFVLKTVEVEPNQGWSFPVDTNQDGIYEILKFGSNSSDNADFSYNIHLNYLDFTDALAVENESKNSISIFPTISSNNINFRGNEEILNVIVFDILGNQLIKTITKNQLDISHLAKGIYLINVWEGKNSSTHKFIKE